ncbi:hypothetical protein GOODEAATRI_003958, partial [Goodea atripinnis]
VHGRCIIDQVAMSPGEDGLIGIPFPEHSNELLSHLNDQRRTGLLCDLTLTSRGARYPTHRSVMAAVSLYFRRLFGAEEGGGEGGGGFSVCQLDCVAPDALDALLEFAYTATLTIPSSGMRDVLRGAQLLGIQCVADACRDILGETGEAEGETAGEQRSQQTTSERTVETTNVVEKISRRKTDKKKVKKVGSHHNNFSPLNLLPASPASHPSPISDSFRSLPPTQPPSPEPEELHPKLRQNGDPRSIREPGRGATLNGGLLHWSPERPLTAHLPPLQRDKLSEDDDMEGLGERPYTCSHCPARFLHSYDLKNHLSLHSGARPFECPLCHKAFAREDHLQRHRKGHSCLDLRTRRPRRVPELAEEGGENEGLRDLSSPLSLQAHSSVFLPRSVLESGGGSGGPPVIFSGGIDRERSLRRREKTLEELVRQLCNVTDGPMTRKLKKQKKGNSKKTAYVVKYPQ